MEKMVQKGLITSIKEQMKSERIHSNSLKFCKIIRGDVLISPIAQILKISANSQNSFDFSANLLIFQNLVFPDDPRAPTLPCVELPHQTRNI
jgi:hypothetical protein